MKSIAEIKRSLQAVSADQAEALFMQYADDKRAGVAKLIESEKRKLLKLEQERSRLETMRIYEHKYEDLGLVCGIDEAGRGPLAGPVVAGAVILPQDCEILYLNDSKKLSEKKREELFDEIKEKAIVWGIGMPPRRGSMRSISCRQRMRQCGRQYQNFPESRIFCSMMR